MKGIALAFVAFVAVVTFGVCASTPPHTAAAGSQPVARTAGAFFALSVADIEASGQWYREKLGLAVTLRPPRSGPAEVMVLEGGGLIVELIQYDGATALGSLTPPLDDAIKVHGFFKAGFIVSNYDEVLAALRTRGVPIVHGPYAAKDGGRANFIIGDNSGNLIHVLGAQ